MRATRARRPRDRSGTPACPRSGPRARVRAPRSPGSSDLSPFDARRCCRLVSTVARSAITSSSSSPARSPAGSGGPTEGWLNARSTKSTASQLRSAPRNRVPRPSPGFAPGGSAMCASSKPVWTIFFECDIAESRSTRSSGTGAIATADSKTPGSGRPVRALNSRLEPASERPTSPRFSTALRLVGTHEFACGCGSPVTSPSHEQEEQAASTAGPPQQGQPRQEAQSRSSLKSLTLQAATARRAGGRG